MTSLPLNTLKDNFMQAIERWMTSKGWRAFDFQRECWEAICQGKSGLLNAPTGSGKTYALWLGILAYYLSHSKKKVGLKVLWITPLRALSKDIHRSMQEAVEGIGLSWTVAVRTGDSAVSERRWQKTSPPNCLVTTPESLHLLFAQKNYACYFSNLQFVVVDEWHDLLGTKRGVQVELALSRLRAIVPSLQTWGISATLGNLAEAMRVLLFKQEGVLIKANISKKIDVLPLLPDTLEEIPWAGYSGLYLLDKIIPIVEASRTTLLFINTRAQAEIWYQAILKRMPQWAGCIALHHGSLDAELRAWVEEALHQERLKLVVCTSSLDLGVDFRPVQTVIQVGSPKSVARFLQRAGRSGHQPNQTSRIYFVPVHALEVLELAALQEIVLRHKGENFIEEIHPLLNCFDVLIQYLVTLAVSDGFDEKSLFDEVRQTYCFQAITEREWLWCLQFITKGGESLKAYDEFTKVVVENGFYRVQSTKIALRHRLSIGTIVSEPLVRVQLLNGKYIGLVDESFIAKLNKGETFWLAGRMFALDKLRENVAYVVPSEQKKGHVPVWQGSRLVLSSSLAKMLKKKMQEPIDVEDSHLERFMRILLAMQRKCSVVPHEKQFLIEQLHSKEGFHLFFYPFAGRMVHELMAAWVAYRLSQSRPITFSLAMNDYGFELLSDQEVSISEAICRELFSLENWEEDLEKSLNKVELARRKFREIAVIAGMIFQGYPSKQKRSKHLQASAKLLYDVLTTYEPEHLLIDQSFREAMNGLEKPRFFEILQSLQHQEVLIRKITKPTLFAFPIMVDRMRMQISSESIEDRIAAMQATLLKS